MALPYDYIAGLTDGEGCFSLRCHSEVKRQRKGQPAYLRWRAEFAIVMRADDEPLLGLVQETIGCGTITKSRGTVRYSVQGIGDLHDIILPFFLRHTMYGKKRKDFELWGKAVKILWRHNPNLVNIRSGTKGFTDNPWGADELAELRSIHQEIMGVKTNQLVVG